MAAAIDAVFAYIQGVTHDEFAANDQLQSAVQFKLVILGEAASKVPIHVREQISGINWKEVVGMRNVVAHGYFDVRVDIVWTAITEELPAIKEALGDIESLGDDGTRASLI
jgi:uncharacterized protein with HEPN domain